MCKIIISLLIFMLTLTGCATTANYQQSLNRWQGANMQTLVNTWGQPNSAITLPNGTTTYMYFRQQLYTTPKYPTPSFTVTGTPIYSMGFNTNPAGGGGQTMNLYCRTWFDINKQGIVIDSRFEGNDCIANKWGR
jgi:hypothetical protein